MTTTTHPQFRLPGQAAAHAGPVDMNIMYVMHHGFRRDLGRFLAAARSTPVTDRDTWRALSTRWNLFAWILHNHHSGEDEALWPFLLERADAAGRLTLEAMEAEHAAIDPVLTSCAAGFRNLAAAPDDDVRNALVVRLAAARERLSAHLAHEEDDAIALIQQVMTQQEWEEVERVFRRHLTPRRLAQLVPWGLSGLPSDVVAWLYAQPGGGAHRFLARVTVPRFERRERRLLRHVAVAP